MAFGRFFHFLNTKSEIPIKSRTGIVRWYVALRELDYDMAHIPGPQNVVADAVSRLCENHMQDEPNDFDLRSMNIFASVIENFDIPHRNSSQFDDGTL